MSEANFLKQRKVHHHSKSQLFVILSIAKALVCIENIRFFDEASE